MAVSGRSNHGTSGMIALQEMLIQTDDRAIHLFPAWPENWDTTFKVHAPYDTVIEGTLADGELTDLAVSPPERRSDLVIHPLGAAVPG